MPLRNADATNFIGIDSSVQSSKKLSAAKRMSSRPSAIARPTTRACFISSGLSRRASLRPPELALPAAQTRRVESLAANRPGAQQDRQPPPPAPSKLARARQGKQERENTE